MTNKDTVIKNGTATVKFGNIEIHYMKNNVSCEKVFPYPRIMFLITGHASK